MIFETKSKQLVDIVTKFWNKIVHASNQIDSMKDRLSSIHKQQVKSLKKRWKTLSNWIIVTEKVEFSLQWLFLL
jgi:hypothetical protein